MINVLLTIKKVFSLLLKKIKIFYHEYFDYVFCLIIGSKRVFRARVELFRIRCKYNLVSDRVKIFWIGRYIRYKALPISYINPLKIKYRVRRFEGPSPYIQNGDWDLKKVRFIWDKSIVQLFQLNLKPHETDQYKEMKKAIEKQDWHNSRDCRDINDLNAYFQTLYDIYNDMEKRKYRPSTTVEPIYLNKRRRYYPDEICVSIGRNGEYINERGGGHRLSIAQLLKVDKIPVILIGMHYDFVKTKADWIFLPIIS